MTASFKLGNLYTITTATSSPCDPPSLFKKISSLSIVNPLMWNSAGPRAGSLPVGNLYVNDPFLILEITGLSPFNGRFDCADFIPFRDYKIIQSTDEHGCQMGYVSCRFPIEGEGYWQAMKFDLWEFKP